MKPRPPEEQTEIIFQDAFDFDLPPINFGQQEPKKGQLDLEIE